MFLFRCNHFCFCSFQNLLLYMFVFMLLLLLLLLVYMLLLLLAVGIDVIYFCVVRSVVNFFSTMSKGTGADEEIDFCKVFLRNLPNVFNIEALIWNALAIEGLSPTELFTVNNDDASLCISIEYAYIVQHQETKTNHKSIHPQFSTFWTQFQHCVESKEEHEYCSGFISFVTCLWYIYVAYFVLIDGQCFLMPAWTSTC